MYIRAGFRAVFRQPALLLGEIAWRWAFAAAAWTLIVIALHRILTRVDITQAELLIARHSDLFLIADACARILYQVLPQFARECLVLVPAIALLWIAAATIGRALTLQAILPPPQTNVILSEDAPQNQSAPALRARVGASESKDPCVSRPTNDADTHFGQLTFLNFLRALLALATVLAFFGAIFLVGLALPNQNPTAVAIVAIFLAALVGFLWSLVNWFLALAPIWIVRDGHTAVQSIADSLDLYRRRPASYLGIATSFGLFRLLAFVAAFAAALAAAAAPPSKAAGFALEVVIALVYFAAADFLYLARVAAYLSLDESSQPSAFTPPPFAPEPQPLAAPE